MTPVITAQEIGQEGAVQGALLASEPADQPAALSETLVDDAPDSAEAAGDRLTRRMFFIFFAVLGFAVLCDLLRGLLTWANLLPLK